MTRPGGLGHKEGGENAERRDQAGTKDKGDGVDKSNREERKHDAPADKKDEKKNEPKKDEKPKGKPYDPSNREMKEGLKPYDVPKSPRIDTGGGGGSSHQAETKSLPELAGKKEPKAEIEERLKKAREQDAQQQAQRRLMSRL